MQYDIIEKGWCMTAPSVLQLCSHQCGFVEGTGSVSIGVKRPAICYKVHCIAHLRLIGKAGPHVSCCSQNSVLLTSAAVVSRVFAWSGQ